MNPLQQLAQVGQSVWYDQMHRSLVTKGRFKQLIEEDDLRGVTSNPTIFQKAIGESGEYDDALEALAAKGKTRDEIYLALVLEDISRAADVFAPVFERTRGGDGFISLEVSPQLANDTRGTIDQALELFKALGRRNVMIKIPATPEGIPAIEEAIAAGLNINITLIFSRAVYGQVMEAYLRGLERRVERDLPIDGIASVASFFVSRIDTKADKLLEDRVVKAGGEKEKQQFSGLLGKVAIANAKLAYRDFRQVFSSERFEQLRKRGARLQRPLWASTGTKNPKYRDILYVETLIGADTVNTLPPATYDAFKDHGKVALTIEQDLPAAEETLEQLEKVGISLEKITGELTVEGVKSFADSFVALMNTIEARRAVVARQISGRQGAALGSYKPAVEEALRNLAEKKVIERIWKKDPAAWKSDDAHKKIITNSLGWLTVVDSMQKNVGDLTAFANEVRAAFDHVVVLGMGGSSLCSEVLRGAFGRTVGYPELLVLDTTVPAAILSLERQIKVERTLFIVASKSGTTIEPLMFQRYFWDRVNAKKGGNAGENFIAITDPGTQLQKDAERDRFRRVWVNPADIGGRYSALSYFGLVPAALMGVDVEAFLARSAEAVHACSPVVEPTENPGATLGATLGSLALQGRNKLTIIAAPPVANLGLWIEQLVAESTGKEGKGILPIAGEPLGAAAHYGDDRVFVWIRVQNEEDANIKTRLRELQSAGHPVIELVLRDRLDLADEFFTWEFATAVAGHFLGINPFDQPNVQESKDNTRRLLEEYKSKGVLPEQKLLGEEHGIRIYGGAEFRQVSASGGRSLTELLGSLFGQIRPRDYVALTQYLEDTPEHDATIHRIRAVILNEIHAATTSGYGPRFLHSTGQLHKGGPDTGLFLQITSENPEDLPIPGEPFTFGVLAAAQALGDFQALEGRKRRAVRVHFTAGVSNGLQRLLEAIEQSVTAQAVR
jgi:transaldolase/glucose-6-phosphate isomerase